MRKIVKILWLKSELLHPVDKGGKIRTYNMLKALRRDHHITYLALDDGTADQQERERAEEYCHELVCVPHRVRQKFSPAFYADLLLNLASPLPYFMSKYRSAQMRRKITEYVEGSRFDVLVCDFLMPSINVPHQIPCPTVLFQHNVEAMIWERHYKVQTNPLKRAYLYNQWLRTRAFESATCRRFDCVVAVSREDSVTMQNQYNVSSVWDVPTGVDVEYFRPLNTNHKEAHNLVFTGSMDWLPNEDAIQYFTEQILPRIKKMVPDVRLTVVGRNPSASLCELSKRDSSIVVTGRVEDVRPFIDRAAAYVVPLRIGGGTRLKIYEAMAMEKPIISTSVGAEGLPVQDGVELLIADDPELFADRVVRVITDETLAHQLGAKAATTVRERFGWSVAAERFSEICYSAIQTSQPARMRVTV